MRRGRSILFAAAAMVLTMAVSMAAKPRVAVIDFENKARWTWYDDGAPSELLVYQLVEDGRFSVIEREKLKHVMAEQNLGASGAVTPQTAAKIGKILGVNYIITGAVSEWGAGNQGGHVGGTSLGLKKYTATVDIRAIDVNTAEILAVAKGEGKGKGVSFGGRLPIGRGFRGLHVGVSEGYSEKKAADVLTQAVEHAGMQLTAKLVELSPGAAAPGADLPKIAKVAGNKVYINKGGKAGIEVGQTFGVYNLGEEIVDPDTGQVLDQAEERVAKVRVTSVKDNLSIAEIVEGSGVEVGSHLKPE